MADPQLVQLHLALRRRPRGAGRPQRGQGRLGHERQAPDQLRRRRRPPDSGARAATSSTTSTSTTCIRTTCAPSSAAARSTGCYNENADYILGTKGTADDRQAAPMPRHRRRRSAGATRGRRTTCTRPSTTSSSPPSATASRSTTATGWHSTLLAIMGRMAAYTGQQSHLGGSHQERGRPCARGIAEVGGQVRAHAAAARRAEGRESFLMSLSPSKN